MLLSLNEEVSWMLKKSSFWKWHTEMRFGSCGQEERTNDVGYYVCARKGLGRKKEWWENLEEGMEEWINLGEKTGKNKNKNKNKWEKKWSILRLKSEIRESIILRVELELLS